MTTGPFEDGDRKLDADLRAVAQARSRGLAGHPSPEELVDYHLGTLAPEEADALAEHLAFCPECAQAVLDLAAFSNPPQGPSPVPGPDADRDWHRLQVRLKREAAGPAPGTRPPFYRRLSWALAASLLAGLGLSAWNLVLRRDLDTARQPRADITFADLVPQGGGGERSGEAPAKVYVPPGRGRALLLLNLGELRTFPGYRMELLAPGRGPVWAGTDVPRGEDGTFFLEIPAERLAPGPYEIRLYGRRGGTSVHLATYSFEAVRGAPPARAR